MWIGTDSSSRKSFFGCINMMWFPPGANVTRCPGAIVISPSACICSMPLLFVLLCSEVLAKSALSAPVTVIGASPMLCSTPYPAIIAVPDGTLRIHAFSITKCPAANAFVVNSASADIVVRIVAFIGLPYDSFGLARSTRLCARRQTSRVTIV